MFYGLGSAAIYDQWEADGNPGWGWKEIQAAAKRVGTRHFRLGQGQFPNAYEVVSRAQNSSAIPNTQTTTLT